MGYWGTIPYSPLGRFRAQLEEVLQDAETLANCVNNLTPDGYVSTFKLVSAKFSSIMDEWQNNKPEGKILKYVWEMLSNLEGPKPDTTKVLEQIKGIRISQAPKKTPELRTAQPQLPQR